MPGKMIIVSAPSGAGKTTLVKEVLKLHPELQFSISATTRKPRPGEAHAKDYYFLPKEEFEDKIKNNGFIEWEEVYSGTFYGTLKSEPTRIWEHQKHVIFDVDVKGGINIKKQYSTQALSIFIQPPSVEELEKRLRSRATDSEESIQKRVEKAKYELSFSNQFDKVIVNDTLEVAIQEVNDAITQFLS